MHCSEGQMVNRLSLGTHTALEKVWGGTGGEKPLSHSRPGLSQSWDWWPTDWVWKPFQAHKTSSFSISISEVAAVVGNASANKRHCSVTLSYWCLQKQKKWTSGQGCYDGQMLRFFFFFFLNYFFHCRPSQPHYVLHTTAGPPYPGIVTSQEKATPTPTSLLLGERKSFSCSQKEFVSTTPLSTWTWNFYLKYNLITLGESFVSY